MKKMVFGKICIVSILALSLVYAPVSNQPTRASAPPSNQHKIYIEDSHQQIYIEDSHQHQLKEAPNKGLYVIRREGEQTHCKDATPEEAQVFNNTDPNLPLYIINPTSPEIVTNAADGLTLTLRATAQLDANPQAKAAFIRAAEAWQSIIKSPITMIIDVDFGTTRFGTPYETGVLGATSSQIVGSATIYPTVRSSLISRATSAAETALYNTLPIGSVPTTIGSTTEVDAATSVFRALGILPADPANDPTGLGNPPRIGFNSAFSFDFDPSNGIDADKIDFEGVAAHEIGHALGFNSEVGSKELDAMSDVAVTTWDIFRFRPGITTATFSTAQRVLSSGGNQIFFIGAQEIQLATGRPDGTQGDGDQASHWKDDQATGVYLGIMDPSIRDGQRVMITQNDRDALEFFGHTLSTAPPPTGETFALTSGTAQGGSLTAPAADSCVLGALQYSIVVPTGATQLKIDLNGSQDIDLFARFNQRIAIAGGAPVSDFASEGAAGTESITISSTTTPALQAGTYFIAIGNCGPGASTFNITATVTSGTLSSAVLRSAAFDPGGVMIIKGTGLFGPADLEVNGISVTPPLRVKVKSEAKAKVGGTASELNLRSGANTVRLRINGLFTNTVILNL